MGGNKLQQRAIGGIREEEPRTRATALWALVREQHGVVTRSQLLAHGLSPKAIEHRIAIGRLHPLWRGVYAVGRPEVDRLGRWMAALLSCGQGALLSHRSAAVLWGLLPNTAALEVVIPGSVRRRRPGIRVHRRSGLAPSDQRIVQGIPVTDPISTLVDLATRVPEWRVERAINEADRLDLVDPEVLRVAIDSLSRRPGIGRLKRLLDRQTFCDTGLERRFLSIVRSAKLSGPETQAWVNGYRVDFYWPRIGLVVETDGLRHHRTESEQASDRRRDQAHTAAGLTTLRFAEGQIRYEPQRVGATLAAVVSRLSRAR
jgi:very-short-patch-repair endonuclease